MQQKTADSCEVVEGEKQLYDENCVCLKQIALSSDTQYTK